MDGYIEQYGEHTLTDMLLSRLGNMYLV